MDTEFELECHKSKDKQLTCFGLKYTVFVFEL